MRELVDSLERWAAAGRRAALARVVGPESRVGSRLATALAVNETGEVAGSLDEPGAESAMVPAALAMLESSGSPSFTSVGDDQILLAPADWTVLLPLADALRRGRDVALAVQVRGPAVGAAMLVGGHGRLAGSLGDDRLDTAAGPDALGALALRRTTTVHYGHHGTRQGRDVAVFVESFNRPARLVVLGAAGLTAALVRVGSAAGFRVTVCDPRPAFSTGARYPAAAAVVTAGLVEHLRALVQLGPADAVLVVTADPDEEAVAMAAAMATRAGFVGAFGTGHDPPASPGQIAVAVCNEIVARGRGATPAPPPPSFR